MKYIYIGFCTDQDSYELPVVAADNLDTCEKKVTEFKKANSWNSYWRMESNPQIMYIPYYNENEK